jgi:hypothetical protein
MNIFFKDLLALYQGRPLPPLRLQYKDYSEWQNSAGQRQAVREQEQYWLRLFDGEIPVLALPTDYPRSALRQFDGDSVDFEIDRRETGKLKKLAADEAVTLYILMLTIFNVLLYKLSGSEDVVVGTGISGRSHADLSGIVGMFVNMLALRNLPRGEETFSRFLQAVKGRTVEAFENQDYQFENLVEKVVTLRQPGRSPLFDVVFQLQNPEVLSADIAAQEIPGLKLGPFDCESKTSKFDLVLVGVEAGDRILFSLEFCTKLFKRQKIEKFIRFFREISARVVENRDIKLKDIAVTHDLRPINGVMPEDEPGDFDFPDK